MERDARIDPDLKSWLDHVLVPAMVRQYLAICRAAGENSSNTIPSEESDPSLVESIQ